MTAGRQRPTVRQRLRAVLATAGDIVAIAFALAVHATAGDVLTMAFARRKAIRITSAGQSIRGTIYYPEAARRAPCVLLLHTASGLTPHEHAMAARLARAGYIAMVIAYAKRTIGSVMRNDWQRQQLEQITVDGLRVLQADPLADPDRTAVIGLSLGGFCYAPRGCE